MNILVVGDKRSHEEFNSRFETIPASLMSPDQLSTADVERADVIFDFGIADTDTHARLYQHNRQAVLFLNSVKTTLLELSQKHGWSGFLVGFNGLPGMFNREHLELTCLEGTASQRVSSVCDYLQAPFVIVQDRVGMVTPRVLCMIINEAFYTVQEGTAGEKDIDTAMKLGTNYPAGPFEFFQSIGANNVYQLLDALYRDTREERYKICPLLKRHYLSGQQPN